MNTENRRLRVIILVIAIAVCAVFLTGVHKNSNKDDSMKSSGNPDQRSSGGGSGGGGTWPWPSMTESDCTEVFRGVLIGDIGDGSTHRSNYRCESNGQPPIGTIVYDSSSTNIPVEGMVCCGPDTE
eukprot:CAMPEP_0198127236 /NCGR_PEP_ID=MMETSP1442-20131203/46715_1 /TAXON_ID= /ORGANISM="Craspedostauros australis, Strain CCMP3328" /LENGTH=125 /DNA_ID=CAMNT_0043787175 /DNA_START=294 /DNA_END=671 /DNA_ORIENTATION=-